MERKLGNNTKKAICVQLVLGSLLILPVNFSSIGEAAGVTINVPDNATYNNLGPEYKSGGDVVSSASSSDNTVTIGASGAATGPTISGRVFGGKSSDVANNNTVNFYSGSSPEVYGGYAEGSATAVANNNLIQITDSTVNIYCVQNSADATSSATANNNTINIENSTTNDNFQAKNSAEGDIATASGNSINITKGSIVKALNNSGIENYATGKSAGTLEKNSIAISDSTVTASGGGIKNYVSGDTSTLTDNTITFTNSTVTANAYGVTNQANGNKVNLTGNKINITGGSLSATGGGLRNEGYGADITFNSNNITLNNTTIKAGQSGVINYASGNTITFSGNSIISTNSKIESESTCKIGNGATAPTVNLTDNTIDLTDGSYIATEAILQNYGTGDTVTLSGNTINLTNEPITADRQTVQNFGNGRTITLTGNNINLTRGSFIALDSKIQNSGYGDTSTLTDNNISVSGTSIKGYELRNFGSGYTSALLQSNTITIKNSATDIAILNKASSSSDSGNQAEANSNKIIIQNSTINQNSTTQEYRPITNMAQGYNASSIKNTISIDGSTVMMDAYGMCNLAEGYTGNATSNDNTITIVNSTITPGAYNGIYNYARVENSEGNSVLTSTGNSINISGSTISVAGQGILNYNDGGDKSILKNNAINIQDSTIETIAEYGGTIGNAIMGASDTAVADSNIININNSNVTTTDLGVINYANGEISSETTNNTINISHSTITNKASGIGNVATGSNKSTANNNIVNIADSNITGDVYVGFAYGTEPQANGNTLNISGTANNLAAAMLYGGYQCNRSTHLENMGSNNILNMYSKDVTAADVGYFNNYNFYLPTGTKAGDTMLTVTKAGGTDLTGATVDIKGVADDFSLVTGEKVNLIKNTNGVTVDAAQPTTATALKDISTIYDFTLDQDANSLYATVKSVRASEQTKAFLESRLGVSMFVSNGANLIGDNEILSSLAPERKYAGITVMNYGKEKATTGSSVEAKGLSMLLGFGKAVENGKGTLRWAPFVEAGWGSYDAENEFLDSAAVHGNGNTDYYGLGFMSRQTAKNGNYLEGSVRAGRVSDDYTSDLSYNGQDAEYDITTTYYGAHVGIGKVMEHDKYNLDVFAKYFYNKVKGDDVRIFSSDYSFDDTSSNRLKAGFKYTGKLSKNNNWFGGLAWEYEMSGSQEGTVNSYDIASPDYKGHSGVVTAGYTYTPDDKKYDANFSLNERFGKRHGISARVECKLKF